MDRVVVYGSLGLRPGLSELLWAFRKSNKLEEFPVYLDDHPFQLHQRIESETKNGMRTADVVLMPHYMLLRMAAEGILARHASARTESLPTKFRDSGGKWFATGVTFMSPAYDSKRMEGKRLPSDLDDLASGEWKIGMQSLTASKAGNLGAQYVSFLKGSAGEKKWSRFVASLAVRGRVRTYDCIDHLIQGLLDRRHEIALTVYSLAFFRERVAGSPVALLNADGIPPMFTFTSVGLLKTAEDNPSARRFADFLLTGEAQAIIGTIPGISPVKPGVERTYRSEVEAGPRTRFHPTQNDVRELAGDLATFSRLGVP